MGPKDVHRVTPTLLSGSCAEIEMSGSSTVDLASTSNVTYSDEEERRRHRRARRERRARQSSLERERARAERLEEQLEEAREWCADLSDHNRVLAGDWETLREEGRRREARAEGLLELERRRCAALTECCEAQAGLIELWAEQLGLQ